MTREQPWPLEFDIACRARVRSTTFRIKLRELRPLRAGEVRMHQSIGLIDQLPDQLRGHIGAQAHADPEARIQVRAMADAFVVVA